MCVLSILMMYRIKLIVLGGDSSMQLNRDIGKTKYRHNHLFV